MEGIVDKEFFGSLASVIKDPITDGIKHLKDLEAKCEGVIANGCGDIPHDVKTIATLVSDLKRSCVLASQVFATMSKAMAQ